MEENLIDYHCKGNAGFEDARGRGLRRAHILQRGENVMCKACIMLAYLFLCVAIGLFIPLGIMAKASLIVLSAFIATICMLRDSPKDDTNLLRTERELLKFMVPIYVGGGLFVGFVGIDKADAMKCEEIAVPVCIAAFVVASYGLGARYRDLCRRIFEEETQEKQQFKELLQEIAKKLDSTSPASLGETENVVKKTRFTTTMEELKIN